MIGKIVKGTSFSGCVNYVLKEDKSRLLKAVGVYGSPEEIAEQFELQTLLNDKVKNKVGHISLSFSAEDGDRIRDDDGKSDAMEVPYAVYIQEGALRDDAEDGTRCLYEDGVEG